ncbi:ArsR family transcriptional regulator [Anaerolinea thermophila]|uniref:helix-turn-helix transcriptional regulator n=1 Tax=Anaerolinea TaxID=233189 RepID=UPI0034287CD2
MADSTTREKILNLFLKSPVLTAREISSHTGLSPVDIRYHLKILLQENRIEEIPPGLNSPGKVGRPPQRYRLAPTNHPENTEMLILGILKQIVPQCPEPHIWESLAGQIFPESPAYPLPTKLRRAMEVLEKLHYAPRWEATQNGPRIILRSCPYASLWKHHPQICAFDQKMLERLTGISYGQHQCMHQGTEISCIFLPKK